jgi:hypothetical protein
VLRRAQRLRHLPGGAEALPGLLGERAAEHGDERRREGRRVEGRGRLEVKEQRPDGRVRVEGHLAGERLEHHDA